MHADTPVGSWIESTVPPRLDALGWSAWHRRVVLALGITWILDGLEASLIANLAPTLQDPRTLGLSAAQIGLTNTCYLVGPGDRRDRVRSLDRSLRSQAACSS